MAIEQQKKQADAQSVGDYDLLDRIGRGPRTEAWRARSRVTGKDVAVKIVLPEVARRPGFLTLFEKETSGLRALIHPNILPVHDRGKAGDKFFIVQELVKQGSLRDALRTSAMPVTQAVKVVIGVCEALDYAHRRGLPHRHLVPENVFVVDDVPRVSDFALSLFTAPSPAEGGDVAGDLAAVGALLYNLVAGQPPPVTLLPLEGRVQGVTRRLDDVLARCLSPSAPDRFRRASELSLALMLLGKAEGARTDERSDDLREAVAILAREKLIAVSVSEGATPEGLREALKKIEQTLASGGPWKIAYDLSGLRILDDAFQDQILRLHVRHLRNIARVGFCSPRAMIRASALVIGRTNDGRLPWKVFSAAPPMRQWLEEVTA